MNQANRTSTMNTVCTHRNKVNRSRTGMTIIMETTATTSTSFAWWR